MTDTVFMVARKSSKPPEPLRVAGIFSGIGGLELGLSQAGHESALLCEIDDSASRVLRYQFPKVRLERDVRDIQAMPKVDLIVAGFPCQDLSQAGRMAGIGGERSGLVSEVFRLAKLAQPQWLLLENVSFMLALDQGRAMTYLVDQIESLGYRWAYRVVDSRAFGLPQRRKRVLFLASKSEDPCEVLFSDEAGEPAKAVTFSKKKVACGFYWTEGSTGLGWAIDSIPPLKGGSTLGIPSPPAIWMPNGQIITPDIRDAERLQGFPSNWTACATDSPAKRNGPRWKLVGNAVSVPVAQWIGKRLAEGGIYEGGKDVPLCKGVRWPSAAWGSNGQRFTAKMSEWPVRRDPPSLTKFLKFEGRPLSVKATQGFLKRARASSLKFKPGFLEALDVHLAGATV